MIRFHAPAICVLLTTFAILSRPCQAQSAQTPAPKLLLEKGEVIPLPGVTGRGDYLTIFERRLYVANTDSGSLSVVDLKDNKIVATIADLPRCHGFAGVPDENKGFVTVGGENKVAVIDLKSDTVTGKIDVGEEPDAILYAQSSNLIYVACHKAGVATLIDPKRDRVVGTIPLGGTAEFAREDWQTGLIYQSVESTNEVAVVDPFKQAVLRRLTLGAGTAPTGLEIDSRQGLLFVGCPGKNVLAILPMDGAAPPVYLAIGGQVDTVEGDASGSYTYTANGEGTLTAIRRTAPDVYEVVATIPTEPGTHTIASDNNSIYTLNNGVVTLYAPRTESAARYTLPETPRIPESLKSTAFVVKMTVRLFLNADGSSDDKIVKSSGYPALDEAVLKAFHTIKFKPAQMNDEPVDDCRDIGITFDNRD